MRAGFAWCLVVAPFALACEGVPDLTFASPVDASAPSPVSVNDASPIGADGSSGPLVPDAAVIPIPVDDSGATPLDAAPSPTDAASPLTGCPSSSPPPGITCCGAVACKGNKNECICSECAYCASYGFCCPSTMPPPGYCATSLNACD